jgi:hypothetical protein
MPKRPTKSNSGRNIARAAHEKGEKFTAKHAKITAHRATEKRVSSKGRG